MELHDVWFVLIAVLWNGYFFLEGFDFGVGVLTKLLARDRLRVLSHLIDSVALLALVRVFADWGAVTLAPWFLLVAVTAAAAAGAALRWESLPWLEEGARVGRRSAGLAASAAVTAALIGLVAV